jgi:hypothetical protein
MMKTVAFVVLASVCLLCLPMTSFAVVVYENNYNSETIGNGFPAWNWGDNGITTHTATFADDGTGNIVVKHDGLIDNSLGTGDVNTRFGSKWDFTVAGNTSTNPADYTIEFDVRSVSGNWNPIALEFFVLTKESGGDYGLGSGASNYAFNDGLVHVSKKLSDLSVGWWQGTAWNLTNPNWSMEIGGPPWPGTSVPAGTPAWDQVWTFDNLKISMVPEPSTIIALLGLGVFGGLALLRRKRV